MSQYTMTIDGQPVSSPGTLSVINPATGEVFAEVFAEVPDCTREQLETAMQSAQRIPGRLHGGAQAVAVHPGGDGGDGRGAARSHPGRGAQRRLRRQ